MCLFFAGSETAITSVHTYQWDAANNNKKSKNYKYVTKLLKNFNLTLGCVLIGNTVFSIVCSSLVTLVVEGLTEGDSYSHLVSGIVSFILALIVLIFCEYLPKSIARRHGVKWLKTFGVAVYVFYILFFPLNYVLNKMFGKKKGVTTSEREINGLVLDMQNEGVLEREEALLVKHSLNFDEMEVGDIYVPFDKINKVSQDMDDASVLEFCLMQNKTRIPVIKSKSKKIIGYIISDEIYKYKFLNNGKKINWKQFIHAMPVVHPSTKLNVVLRIMQRSGINMFCVENSNSSASIGIITTENVVEQIVGEIYDEFDKVNKYRRINSFTWLINGNYKCHTFMKRYFKRNIKQQKLLFIEYFESVFKTKKFTLYSEYECTFFKITLTRYENDNPIFELIKK